MTTSTPADQPSEEQLAANFAAFAANMREQLAPFVEYMQQIQAQVQESMAAIGTFLVEVYGPQLRRCGLLGPPAYRTSKAERRSAKRHLALQRRTDAAQPPLGVAATARWLAVQERTHG